MQLDGIHMFVIVTGKFVHLLLSGGRKTAHSERQQRCRSFVFFVVPLPPTVQQLTDF